MTKRVVALVALTIAALLGVVPTRAATANPPACKHTTPRGNRHNAGCTHGDDPAPPYVDVKHRDPVVASNATTGATMTGANGTLPCYGDGVTGNRVEAIYAVPAGTTDRYATVAPFIRTWALAADNVFNASAAETGGVRHVKWVTDAQCNLVVDHVNLSSTGASSFDNTIAELQNKGYTRGDRKYLVWTDADVYCGIGEVFQDDTSSPGNINNGGDAMFARVDTGCWGLAGNSVEAHELMHTLGGVQLSAPHATSLNHCWDMSDVMCYADGSGSILQQLCPTAHLNAFDCNHDDYFSTAPSSNSYLAKHWNTANSSFLATTNSGPSWHLVSAGAPSVGLVGALSATSMAPGRLDLFGRGGDNALWHNWYDGAWHGWESLGGVLTSAPSVSTWGGGRLDVFVRSTDNALWHLWFFNGWRNWERLGGILTSAPAAVSWSNGRLDVFVRSGDNGMWHLWFLNGWQSWDSLGGYLTSDPAADTTGYGKLDVYMRSVDNALWSRSFGPTGWSGWASLGGTLTSGPTASTQGAAHRDVFAAGSDGGWMQRTYDAGTWSAWTSLGTAVTGPPAAVSMSSGRIDVFGVTNGTAYDRWYG